MTSLPSRPEDQLRPAGRQQLDEADRRLREAVAAYERFLGRELALGEPVPVYNASELAEAQEAVEAAERELWRLREDLLGWVRPPWAPRATLVADWFSPEDSVYDEVDSGSAR